MTMNKNSNTYQILYSAIMVILVGTILAFVYMTLKPQQDLNKANDTRQQILGAIHVVPENEKSIEKDFNQYIKAEYLVNTQGEVADSGKNKAFDIDMKTNVKLAANSRKLPLYVSVAADGAKKYIIPVYGGGLWGPIWGYIAVNADGKTVYGTNFSHESETPGLGARITEAGFQDEFKEKSLYVDGTFKSVEVLKKGQKSSIGAQYVDALSGATITSRGVSDMLQKCLAPYDKFFKKLQGSTASK